MTTEIKEFSAIEAAITVLRERFNFIPVCYTTDELKKTKTEYKEIRKYEIDLDDKRLELTKDLRDQKKKIDNSAKDIDQQLKTISKPFKDAIDIRVQELKEIEQKRIASLRSEILLLANFIIEATGKDSNGISEIIEAVDLIEVDEHFEELQAEARETLNITKAKLALLLSGAIQKEATERQLAKEREENKRLAEEREAEQEELRQLRAEKEAGDAKEALKQQEVEDDIPFVDQGEDVPCETTTDLGTEMCTNCGDIKKIGYICECSKDEDGPLGKKEHYDETGTLVDENGNRSVFDDVNIMPDDDMPFAIEDDENIIVMRKVYSTQLKADIIIILDEYNISESFGQRLSEVLKKHGLI